MKWYNFITIFSNIIIYQVSFKEKKFYFLLSFKHSFWLKVIEMPWPTVLAEIFSRRSKRKLTHDLLNLYLFIKGVFCTKKSLSFPRKEQSSFFVFIILYRSIFCNLAYIRQPDIHMVYKHLSIFLQRIKNVLTFWYRSVMLSYKL